MNMNWGSNSKHLYSYHVHQLSAQIIVPRKYKYTKAIGLRVGLLVFYSKQFNFSYKTNVKCNLIMKLRVQRYSTKVCLHLF